MNITYLDKGVKQDLSDVVRNMDHSDTPFSALIGEEKAISTTFQWKTEGFDAVDASAAIEGADAPTAVDNQGQEYLGYVQIFTNTLSVSGTSLAISTAGSTNKEAHQIELKLKSLKRSVESVYLGGQAKALGSSSVARKTDSAQTLIDVANTKNLAGVGITEDTLLTHLGDVSMKQAGLFDAVMMMPAVQKVAFDKAMNVNRAINVDAAKFSDRFSGVSTYTCAFGVFDVIMNPFMRVDTVAKTSDILIFEPDSFTKHILRPYSYDKLGKKGDKVEYQFITEQGLSLSHPKAAVLFSSVKYA